MLKKKAEFSACFAWFRFVSVNFGLTETPKLAVLLKKRNNRNKRFVSDSAETSFGSSFGCFESKLVSKDTLLTVHHFSPHRPPSWAGSRVGRLSLSMCLYVEGRLNENYAQGPFIRVGSSPRSRQLTQPECPQTLPLSYSFPSPYVTIT